jgi:hypothetical protein
MHKSRHLIAVLALGAVLAGPADLWTQFTRWISSTLDAVAADGDKGGAIDPNGLTGEGDKGGYIDPDG